MMLTEYLEEWTYIAVFILGSIPWIELVAVVPLGIAFGLNPVAVGALGLLGNWITMMIVIVLFDRIQQWRRKRRGDSPEGSGNKRWARAHHIWNRYGLPGLSLLGPLIIGSHIAAAVAMGLNAPRRAVTLWMTLSLVLWTLVIAVAAYYGFSFLGITSNSAAEA